MTRLRRCDFARWGIGCRLCRRAALGLLAGLDADLSGSLGLFACWTRFWLDIGFGFHSRRGTDNVRFRVRAGEETRGRAFAFHGAREVARTCIRIRMRNDGIKGGNRD
jgi:hypothetical protein